MKKRRTSKKSRIRRVGRAARVEIGYPSRKKYRTQKRKSPHTRKGSTSRFSESVIEVGAAPDTLTWKEIQAYVKRVADKSRGTLVGGGRVSVKLNSLFARQLPQIESESGEVVETEQYDVDHASFPNVGGEWEWRQWFSTSLSRDLTDIRAGVREMFMEARTMNNPPQYVFIDAIVIQKWSY